MILPSVIELRRRSDLWRDRIHGEREDGAAERVGEAGPGGRAQAGNSGLGRASCMVTPSTRRGSALGVEEVEHELP